MSLPIYADLNFPPPPPDRPYVFINMVATIDGKTVSGTRDEDVSDLGSKNDHLLMRRIEDAADCVMVGATTLRAASTKWDPRTRFRVVVSNRGGFDYSIPFFQGEGQAFVACAEGAPTRPEMGVEKLEVGHELVEPAILLKRLRELGSERLLCFGGSELNSELLRDDLVDELFLTIAPKIKLGRDLPTYAGGEPLDRDAMLGFTLLEHHALGDEVFLRYRRSEAR